MTVPTATYRIQFRNGMTFDRARSLVPYLKRLGISHLYASPIFTATSGSTHGYDVTNANEIDPEIGGREGFDHMVRALKSAGLGLIIDIVPNHMAASLENPWWRDVVENGENSRYARHFDIDWSRRLTLPFLGDTFEDVLAAGDIAVKPDPKTGKPALAYYETFYPLSPQTYEGREAEILAITDKAGIAALHERQPYRLISWRDARRDLSYRRFFEITGLAGIRVEDKAVFDDAHRLILELVHSGAVDGLRVDHVDGLADPKAYLERLRQEAGSACHITVEKILGEGEHIPTDWPISGTTGYEFIAALSDALVDNAGMTAMRKAYDAFIGKPVDMPAELRNAKLLMADNNFAGEFARLLQLATEIARLEGNELPSSQEDMTAALRELLAAFPVYRTYGTSAGLPAEGASLLETILDNIRTGSTAPQPQALDFLARILKGDVSPAAAGEAATFRTHFQQLTGPLMAKSVEDTLFFRHAAVLALNEVGAEPLPRTFSLDHFHAEMTERRNRQPDALSATTTHDTKRGEDARARLYALTEAPDRWAASVARWQAMNGKAATALETGPAPEPAVEWMIYQSLAGVWPTDLAIDDEGGLKALEDRFLPYLEKALREAKLRTNWGDGDEAYEKAVLDYARHLLSPGNQDFLADFTKTLHPFVEAGLVNSLTQTIVKLTAPGVPDIYQGAEGLDFSLVDPDNRREPDFSHLETQLAEQGPRLSSSSEASWQSGSLKQHVIASLLRLRQEAPSLFREGDYLPLQANGGRSVNLLAFARADFHDAVIVITPRLVLGALHRDVAARSKQWVETEVSLPPRLANRRYRDLCSGKTYDARDRIGIARVFVDHPFAILVAS